ncbi:hypothetical protein BDB01DRAFT_783906, partial [Pilobolus umbonatus]
MGAGKEIVLIDSEWNTIWKRQPSTEIKLAKFEPRSNVFATVGKVTATNPYVMCDLLTRVPPFSMI